MPESRIIYVGIKGAVLALDAANGRQLWLTRLKGSGFVSVVVEGRRLFATTQGEAFCLERSTGALLWHNPLKGFGLGLASIATELGARTDLPLVAEKQQRDDAAAAAAASSTVAVAG
jgi:outer membrane protein assembly factor BamB